MLTSSSHEPLGGRPDAFHASISEITALRPLRSIYSLAHCVALDAMLVGMCLLNYRPALDLDRCHSYHLHLLSPHFHVLLECAVHSLQYCRAAAAAFASYTTKPCTMRCLTPCSAKSP
eukprot:2465169-Pleurochrysis_carterae.AAC.3